MHTYIHTAQPTLKPQEHQSVCRGESISYNCIGNGSRIALYSPPIIEEISALSIFSSEPLQTCSVIVDSGAAIILVDSTASPSFVVTYTLYISNEQSEGLRSVICQASGEMTTANFSVLGNIIIIIVVSQCN